MGSAGDVTINIEIDQDACVGCELCVDECPTGVLAFVHEEKVAKVDNLDDCIECLSCYYVCPAAAVEHDDAHICPDFYRDFNSVNFAEGIL